MKNPKKHIDVLIQMMNICGRVEFYLNEPSLKDDFQTEMKIINELENYIKLRDDLCDMTVEIKKRFK